MEKEPSNFLRTGVVAISVICLLLVYLFQRYSYIELIYGIAGLELATNQNQIFIINRTLRLVVNDLLCMGLIYGLFANRNYFKLAFYLFLIELVIILPIYLFLKLNLEGPSEISSPLLSPIHRMIVNPLLMLILIGGFYYQRFIQKSN